MQWHGLFIICVSLCNFLCILLTDNVLFLPHKTDSDSNPGPSQGQVTTPTCIGGAGTWRRLVVGLLGSPSLGAALEIFPTQRQKYSYWFHVGKKKKEKKELAAHTEQLVPPPKLPISAFNNGD
jgi:hypothetical protein